MRKVEQYQSDAGHMFANERDAHADDLRHMLCEAAGNDPIARQIAQAIAADPDKWVATIGALCQRQEVLPLRIASS